MAEKRNTSFLEPPEGEQPYCHLNFSPVILTSDFFLSPEPQKNKCVVVNHQVWGDLLEQSREINILLKVILPAPFYILKNMANN